MRGPAKGYSRVQPIETLHDLKAAEGTVLETATLHDTTTSLLRNRCDALRLFGGKLRGHLSYSVAGFTEVVSFDLSWRQSCCNAGPNSDSYGAQRQWLSLEKIR